MNEHAANPEDLQNVIREVLRAHIDESRGDFGALIAGNWDELTGEATKYAIASARGDVEATKNLEHVKAQAHLLGGTIAARETKRVSKTVEAVVLAAARTLGVFLKGAL